MSAGLLRGTAERLRGQLRRGDVAARLGADTFAMVLGWPATPVDPRRVLDRIADRLSRPLAVDATLLAPTVSLGLVIADPHLGSGDGDGHGDRDREADALIQRAFEAMQRSKVAGEPVVAQETDSEAEQARVAAVASYDVHDGALDEVFRATAQLAATACATRYALVTFIDADLQWVRAVVGDRLQVARGTPGPRHLALCDVAVRRRSLVVMPDLRDDPRCASRHVAWQDGVAFYAGAPLVDREGRAIGTLCVLDDVPRDVTDRQRQALTNLADLLMDVLTARRTR